MRPRLVASVFIGVFALSVALLVLLLPEDSDRRVQALGLSLALGLIASALVCLAAVVRLAGLLLGLADPDKASQRKIGRAVVRNDDAQLTDAQRRRAAHYAAAMASYEPAIVTMIALILASVLVQQLFGLAGPGDGLGVFRIVLSAGIVVAALVIGPLLARPIRAVRRYAREHPVDATAGFEPAK